MVKYLVMLGDGMADTPVEALGGKTPLQAAEKPHMDFLAQHGSSGMARTVPEGMPPGSDTANLSVMGYDPTIYYSGRSPLEAVSMGIQLAPDDVAFRCNLVTLSEEARLEDCVMVDYSAGEISTQESTQLIRFLAEQLDTSQRHLYPGISYRHCLVLNHAEIGTPCTPPHDITGKPVQGHLPQGKYGEALLELMERSRTLLANHPVNLARIAQGKNPANCCWFWGEGTRPALPLFEEKFGVKGGVISAVDLIKGIGICAGLTSVDVPGVTGNWDTNFSGKAQAALELYRKGYDFVYIHVEAPDECGHHGDLEHKIQSIQSIDREILGPVMEGLREMGEPFRILLAPDHPTPLAIRTHTPDPIPFVIYDSQSEGKFPTESYCEAQASSTGWFVPKGCQLMETLLQRG